MIDNPYASYPSLRDKSVLVTGGGSGIGASIVRHFVAQGARVAFVDIDRKASAALVAASAADSTQRPLFIDCDLTDIAALREAIQRAGQEHGAIQVLINNAARDTRYAMEDVTVEIWDEMQATNLRHVFFASQAVAPGMRAAGGGSIINFSSPTFYRRPSNVTAYATAKAGIVGLTRTLSRELGEARIRVNAIIPGWTMTERQIELWLTPEAEEILLRTQTLKDKVMPEDIARMALFLAADDSRMLSSQIYVVDGGLI